MKSQDGDGASHVPDGEGASQIPDQWLQLRQPLPPSDAVSSPTNFPAPTSLSSSLDQHPEQNFRQHQFPPLASFNFRNVIGLQNRSVLPNNLSGDPNRSSSPSSFRIINSSGMPQSIPRTGKEPFGNTNTPPSIPNQISPATGIYGSDNFPNEPPQAKGIYWTHNIPNQYTRIIDLVLRIINSNLMPEQRFQKLRRIETNPDHPVPNYQIPEAAESGTERNARNLEMQSDQLKFIAEFFDNEILAQFQQFMEKFETLEREKCKREDMWRVAEAKIPVAGNSGASSSGSGNWLADEEETLIKLRTQLDEKSRQLRRKAPTWQEISGGMEILGYKKDARRCRVKWQNITRKYFKYQKKACSYFELLREYYSARERDPERLFAPEMDNNGDPSTFSAHRNNVEEEEED